MTRTAPRATARDRLLASAAELFYAEGIHTVGIDRVIEHAGVAKASLYNSFGSKDELVRAYLTERHEATSARILADLEEWDTPREKILGVFVSQHRRMAEPSYRGCPFVAATAESREGSGAMLATAAYRDWLRTLFTGLVEQAGVRDVAILVRQLMMLYDGTALSLRLDGARDAGEVGRSAAATLVDAALA